MEETLRTRLLYMINEFKKVKQESNLATIRLSRNKEYSEAAMCKVVEETLTTIIINLEELLK